MNSKANVKVVVIGAGFAGLEAAKTLARSSINLTIIDRLNHHLFQPLLYQVATSGLSPAEIAYPIRSIFRRYENVNVVLGEVTNVDQRNRLVKVGHHTEFGYDYLIVATGASHNYFGHPEWDVLAPGLKSIDDATEIRRRILLAFEEAEVEPNPQRQEALMTFVIVGGGPTGVEMAGAIAELARFALRRDFRHINPRTAKIILVEGGDRILQTFPPSLSAKARLSLERLGVKVLSGSFVSHIDKQGVRIGDQQIPSSTVIWAAGVQASPVGKFFDAILDASGRVEVTQNLNLANDKRVFVVGDLALVRWTDNTFVPGVAPAAMQQGRHAARNILRDIENKPLLPFKYFNKGNLATIGRAAAVADFTKIRLSGYIAWMTWLVVHLAFLVGFKNRLFVLLQWMWSYFSFQKGTRLITGGIKRFRDRLPGPE